jgi:ATP-dependent Clp protease ATP-binding subunit ClpX
LLVTAQADESNGIDMTKELRCSFCDKAQDKVAKLIAAPSTSAYICDECVAICSSILRDDENRLQTPPGISRRIPTYLVRSLPVLKRD